MQGFPYNAAPTGWFQVGWLDELEPGQVRSMRYFEKDLVCWRTESGHCQVMDAFCGHLGAHLGVGGSVCGENIVCPFHGWQWTVDGENAEIPYSEQVMKNRVRSYPTRVANGAIFVWHDVEGNEPAWELPVLPESVDSAYFPAYPHGVKGWSGLALQPQVVAENTVDPAHFQYVHRAPRGTVIEKFATDGPYAYVLHDYAYGKEGSSLTPGGTIDGQLEVEAWGVGMVAFRMKVYVDAVQLLCVTPIDAETSDVYFSVWLRKEGLGSQDDPDTPGEKAKMILAEQIRQAELDMPIWENMRYVQKPPLPREEATTYLSFRKWSRQFYPADDPSGTRVAVG